jgi:hypothetical protein
MICALVLCLAGAAAAQDQPGVAMPVALGSPAPAASPALPAAPGRLASGLTRWQIGISYEYFRLRLPNGSGGLQGLNSSVTYFTNDWLGIEGDVGPAFGQISPAFHTKFLWYGGGVRAYFHRDRRWQPWAHALFGGTHLNTTQGIGPASHNGFGIVAGAGLDRALSPMFAVRAQGDLVETHLVGGWQTNFQIKAGIVFNF